jgi:ABC-2 type transport system ATP-binding protein
MPEDKDFYHPSLIRNTLETFSFLPQQEVETRFKALQVPYSDLKCETVNLEDAFIGLTGKY